MSYYVVFDMMRKIYLLIHMYISIYELSREKENAFDINLLLLMCLFI